MHNASTAQEVEIVTPSATNFEFRVGKHQIVMEVLRNPIILVAMERSISYASKPSFVSRTRRTIAWFSVL